MSPSLGVLTLYDKCYVCDFAGDTHKSFSQALEVQEPLLESSLQPLALQWTWQSLQVPMSSSSSVEGNLRLSAFCWEGWNLTLPFPLGNLGRGERKEQKRRYLFLLPPSPETSVTLCPFHACNVSLPSLTLTAVR